MFLLYLSIYIWAVVGGLVRQFESFINFFVQKLIFLPDSSDSCPCVPLSLLVIKRSKNGSPPLISFAIVKSVRVPWRDRENIIPLRPHCKGIIHLEIIFDWLVTLGLNQELFLKRLHVVFCRILHGHLSQLSAKYIVLLEMGRSGNMVEKRRDVSRKNFLQTM